MKLFKFNTSTAVALAATLSIAGLFADIQSVSATMPPISEKLRTAMLNVKLTGPTGGCDPSTIEIPVYAKYPLTNAPVSVPVCKIVIEGIEYRVSLSASLDLAGGDDPKIGKRLNYSLAVQSGKVEDLTIKNYMASGSVSVPDPNTASFSFKSRLHFHVRKAGEGDPRFGELTFEAEGTVRDQ